jgi:hypothetical protein
MKNNSSSGIHMFCLGLRGSLEIEGAIARHVILKKGTYLLMYVITCSWKSIIRHGIILIPRFARISRIQ